jgi:hypothetical protein
MIHDLLGMMTGELQKGLEGLSRWLPKGATQLMQALPGALRAATTVTPQLTQALFEIAGSVLGDLVGMLPELTPVLLNGFVDLFASSYKGIEKGLASVWQGIENAIHDGKTQIAGAWVDDEQIAKFNFKIDTNLAEVEGTVEQAYSEVRKALQTDILTPKQRAEVEGMIGDDYDAIKSKLTSFGLSEEEAAPIAETVSNAGKIIKDAFAGLDVGVDAATLAKWTVEANGSRLLLREKLKLAGLTDGDIAQVLGVFDEMTGKVKDGTPSIVQDIYDKLTDGKPDDTQTVEAINKEIGDYIDGLNTELETTYETKVGELDITAADYQTKKAELDEWYNASKASIAEMDSGMRSLVTELANAPTAVVKARLEEFVAMEQKLFGIEQKIDSLNEKARSAAENAYRIVRSGTNTDEFTVEQAVNLKITEYALDAQAAEDARRAAVEELNASGKTGEEYELELGKIDAQFTVDSESAKDRFNTAFGEIISGIAEGENVDAALKQAYDAYKLTFDIDSLIKEIQATGEVNPAKTEEISKKLGSVLGDAFNPDRLSEHIEGPPDRLINYLSDMMGLTDDAMSDAAQAALGGKIGAVYQGLLDGGFLTGTGFDTTTVEGQLAAIFSAVDYSGAVSEAQGKATDAAVTVAETATTEEKTALQDGGKNAGLWMDIGTAQGIRSGASTVINAAVAVAKRTIAAFKNVLGIASPSKVMMELGAFTGEGYAIGLQNSMANAVNVAKRMSGEIITAAEMSRSMRVSMPNLSQEIILANEQSQQPVNLYVNGRQLGKVMAADNQTAQNNYNKSIALGVGK